MNDAEIHAELTQIFREQFRNPALVIEPGMNPGSVAGWDSAAMVSIIMTVEEQFDIEFSPNDLKEFRSIDDLVRLLRRHDV